jgi:hypothetical protein
MSAERRRNRNCPSCGGTNLRRESRVPGWTVPTSPSEEVEQALHLNPYCDVCNDCGLLSLYVRLSDTEAG